MYIMSLIVPGVSCYTVIDIDNIIELDDCYNIIGGDTDIFIEKDKCIIDDSKIIYKNNNIELYLEAA